MNGTPLLIGDNERSALAKLRELAAARPIDMPRLKTRLETPKGKAEHMARMTEQSVEIPFAYLVTFSIETGHPIGTCRHMSMSVNKKGRVPNQHSLAMVMRELGFHGGIEDCYVWLEDLKGHGQAVNVLQPIDAPAGTA